PFCPHGHAIRDGGRTKDLRVATGFTYGCLGGIGQFLQATIARSNGAMAVRYAHHRLGEIRVGVAQGVVHGTVGSPFGPFNYVCGAPASGNAHSVLSSEMGRVYMNE